MTDTPPDWVLIEAAKRSGWEETPSKDVLIVLSCNDTFRALCDMIERYGQPPVDRKLLCAREAMARNTRVLWHKTDTYRSGKMDDGPAIADCIRAIELWESGYGRD